MDYETTISIDDDVVTEYVKDNFPVDDVFPDDEIKDYVAGSFDPDDVFSIEQLRKWAEKNGFVEA